MDKRWRFCVANVKCWARLVGKGITLFIISKSGRDEVKTRITFQRFEDYVFFVNQHIAIANEARKKLDKDNQEKILIELKETLEDK